MMVGEYYRNWRDISPYSRERVVPREERSRDVSVQTSGGLRQEAADAQ